MDLKRILLNVRLLTTHTPPAKDQTLKCYSSVRLGRASFTDRSRNDNHIKHLHKADLKINVLIVMLTLCSQRVIKMARNLQSVLWPLVLRVCDKETS